jgi:hypothetical protein
MENFDDWMKQLGRSRQRIEKTSRDIIAFVRVLPPLLKDHGCASTAEELDRLIFAHDSENEGVSKLMQDNPDHIFEMLRKGAASGE